MTDKPQQFASDNYAGICPEVWAAMETANDASAPAYGDDIWTQRAADAFRTLFDTRCEVFFAFNGTAANSLALAALCQSYHSVICSSSSHVETDECGAPEFFSNGSKLLVAPSPDGKLTPDAIRTLATSRSDIHFPKPRVVTITQPTETGQVYSIAEIQAISATCRDLGLKLHMDGARFAHACATLGCSPADVTWRAGVDVLCFGGTKNGMAAGEAIVFFDTALATDFDYRCKQAGQLASKMRFLAAPWIGLFESGAWLRNAEHANRCANRLAAAIEGVPGIRLAFPVQANAVFLDTPDGFIDALKDRGWRFYTFIGGSARFMFAWDADVKAVDRLARDITELAVAATKAVEVASHGTGAPGIVSPLSRPQIPG
ncbi:MAG: threonine aldolase family protein [Sphingopyxis sp.]|uniref:threonine aldolase family protein n=1 Tax=Sphingopyxis sp. TaxID=1908224 RepID=UPI003D6D2CBD